MNQKNIVFEMITLTIIQLCVIDLVLSINLDIYNNTVIVPCPTFVEIENGEVNLITNYETSQEMLHINCNVGYDLIGPPKILCTDSVWEVQEVPKCTARCKKPPDINNGTIDIDTKEGADKLFKKGTLATYTCIDGFLLTPPESKYRVCEKGIWTGANASCVMEVKITKCKPLNDIKNGYLIHEKMEDNEGYSIGQTVEYECNNGFKLNGESSQQCQEDGVWAPKHPPTCIPNLNMPARCPRSPSYPHSISRIITGKQNYDSAESGTQIEFLCWPKYNNLNNRCEPSKLRCIDGKWMGIPPDCVLATECACPPKVALGTPVILTPYSTIDTDIKSCHYPLNTKISYLCVPGYELERNLILNCSSGGCWTPTDPPVCKVKQQRYYYFEPNAGEPIVFSLVTGVAVLVLLLMACLAILCRKRKPINRSVTIPAPVPRTDLADHATLLHPPDRLALIAFADGMQVGQAGSGLPTYEEATRDRTLGISSARLQRPPWPSIVGRRSRNSPNPDNILFTRQGSFASHTASIRSGGDPMGSTDTMAVSENSTTVTLDTASSHSGSQPASCRAHCGSLASFDTSSVLNTEGVPLLEESELEEMQCGETVSLAMENRSMCDNTSYKLSTASDVA